MITLGTIGTLLASPFVGYLLKFVADWLSQRQTQQQADTNAKEVGRLEAERDQEAQAREATERELEALQNAPQTVDDAVKRLEEGSA